MNEIDILTIKKFNYEGIDYEFIGLTNEHIFEQIPWYEHELLRYIKNLNKSGVYVDVGGNIGNHSLFFLNHCPSTKLYSFEPEDFCYEIIKKNLEKNGKKEFNLFKFAVWNKETELELIRFSSFNNMGMSKVVEVIDKDEKKKYIKANSLDNIILNDEKIVLIKIDAEGSEPKVLEGAMRIIKKYSPAIICEAATVLEFNEINNILIPLGYEVPRIRFNATPTYIWEYKNM